MSTTAGPPRAKTRVAEWHAGEPTPLHPGAPASCDLSLWLALLGLLTAIGSMSIDMYLPSFPTITRQLGSAGGVVEWTLASFFVGTSVGQLFYGPISDRFGRKPPLYFGLTLFTLASAGCYCAPSIPALMAWRLLQGLGGCSGMVIARATVRDRLNGSEAARAFSLMMLVTGLAPMLAPLAGGWILKRFGWRAIFAVLVAFGICLLAGVAMLPETRPPSAEPLRLRKVLHDYLQLLGKLPFIGYTLAAGLPSAGMFAYITGSPFVLIELHHVPPTHFGWFFGANAMALVAATQVNARLLNTYPPRKLLNGGLMLSVAAVGAALLCELSGMSGLRVLASSFFVYLFALGFIGPNATALALLQLRSNAGQASALMGTLQFLLATLAGGLVGLCQNGTAVPLLSIMTGCALCARLASHIVSAPASDPQERGGA